MKTQLFAVAAAAVLLASPLASFAQQSDAPVTRAEVRQQLIQVKQAGYTGTNNVIYPADIQAAEAKVAAANSDAQTGYGPALTSKTQAGPARADSIDGVKPVYFGGQ
ncbi:DUF4148 domain-containing protein [Trinickia terrae]|uniref:DUF4148 domain-containing protein n=1 Tax=Trinickia terrae TaxID=2571161 RepID=A0A4U1I129_9BURK|nr:DUF4148 domain-containing protein [Trinickia terrae]TKC86849.1 DUF4148 domain-containing protein [Trinickia terrae]